MKRTGLNAIDAKTLKLWNEVVRVYGSHKYTLAVNGLDEVVLCKGYVDQIAKGNREAQRVLTELLTAAGC